MKVAIAGLILVCALPASAQKLSVKIIDRQEHDSNYNYFVPGHSYSNTNANANCNGDGANVNCYGTSTTNTTSMPARAGFIQRAWRDVFTDVTGRSDCRSELRHQIRGALRGRSG